LFTPSDFRKGLRIVVEDQPWTVIDFLHIKMGRGRAKIQTKLKHIRTGAVVERVFTSGDMFIPVDLQSRKMQYMYENGGEYAFMDTETFEQVTIPRDGLDEAHWYLIENQEYKVMFLDNAALSVDLPANVVLEVVETEPAARGDTVTNVTKPAKLSTGLMVKVPSFVKEGDKVKVDTRTNEYLERSN
jgi:elongation factor P